MQYTYNGLNDTPEGERGIGVEAEQAALVLPNSVKAGPDGYLAWNAHELLLCNVAAVQILSGSAGRARRAPGRRVMTDGVWTPEEKMAYAESRLWQMRVKGQCLPYADEVTREDPYTLIPADAALSKQYHDARVRVAGQCVGAPDTFAQQNASGLSLKMPDPRICRGSGAQRRGDRHVGDASRRQAGGPASRYATGHDGLSAAAATRAEVNP